MPQSRRKRAILRLSRNGGRRSLHSMPRTLEPFADIAASIRVVRGMRVLLDDDLALVYGVTTKRLREQTRRNTDRFPSDFLIQLSRQELASLKMQNESSSWGGRRSAQLAFTEHGAIMAATVLSSPRAVQMSVYVVRAFAHLRQVAATHSTLAQELETLKQAVSRATPSSAGTHQPAPVPFHPRTPAR